MASVFTLPTLTINVGLGVKTRVVVKKSALMHKHYFHDKCVTSKLQAEVGQFIVGNRAKDCRTCRQVWLSIRNVFTQRWPLVSTRYELKSELAFLPLLIWVKDVALWMQSLLRAVTLQVWCRRRLIKQNIKILFSASVRTAKKTTRWKMMVIR